MDNGDKVTRAELQAHLDPMKEDISEIRKDVEGIRLAMGAGPRWLGNRANNIIDKVLPAAIALGAAWILGDKL